MIVKILQLSSQCASNNVFDELGDNDSVQGGIDDSTEDRDDTSGSQVDPSSPARPNPNQQSQLLSAHIK